VNPDSAATRLHPGYGAQPQRNSADFCCSVAKRVDKDYVRPNLYSTAVAM